MDDLRTFLQEIIADVTFKKVGFSDSLVESGLLDSITLVEVIVAIEEKTGKAMPQHLLQNENFETIDTIVETVSKMDA
ncbi:MAG: acyl carrier protein [Bacteroidia bacterium]|nr:acyl carrier protein [Bacteroidia bacterium]